MTDQPLGATGLKRLHREWRRRSDNRVGLILDSVQTPFNVGSILRTAAAERVDDVWLCGATESPKHPKVQKTAMGSDRFLTCHRHDDAADAVAAAREAGYRVVALELTSDAVPLHDAALGAAVAVVVGHEDRGVRPGILGVCDETVYIPQLGKVGSLNVAVAAAIAVYEIRRREWRGDPHD